MRKTIYPLLYATPPTISLVFSGMLYVETYSNNAATVFILSLICIILIFIYVAYESRQYNKLLLEKRIDAACLFLSRMSADATEPVMLECKAIMRQKPELIDTPYKALHMAINSPAKMESSRINGDMPFNT